MLRDVDRGGFWRRAVQVVLVAGVAVGFALAPELLRYLQGPWDPANALANADLSAGDVVGLPESVVRGPIPADGSR